MAEAATRTETRGILLFFRWLNGLRIVGLSAAVAAGVGLLTYLFAPRTYTATTTLLFANQNVLTDILALAGASGGSSTSGISSLPILGGASSPEPWLTELLRSRKIRRMLAERVHLQDKLRLPREKTLRWLTEATVIKSLQKGLGLSAPVGMAISVKCPGPTHWQQLWRRPALLTSEQARQLCAELANGYVQVLDEYLTHSSISQARQTRQFVQARSREVGTELKRVENELEKLQVQYLMVDPQGQAQQIADQWKDLQKTYTQLGQQLEQMQRSLERTRQLLPRQQVMLVQQETIARNPLIGQLETRLLEERNRLDQLLASGKSGEHPEVQAAQAALASLEKQRREVTEQIQSSVARQADPAYATLRNKAIELEVGLTGTRAAQQAVAAQLQQLKQRLQRLPAVARQYAELARRRDILAELQLTLAKRLEIAAIQEQQESSGRFEQLDEALPPPQPDSPGTVRRMILSFILCGLLLTLGWAYQRGHLQASLEMS